MKILIVTQYFWPENFRINDLVLELKDRGHEVTVLTGIPNYPDGYIYKDYKESKEKYSDYHGINVVRVPLITRGKTSLRLIINYISFIFSATIIGSVKLKGMSFDRIFVYEPSPVTVAIPAIFFKKIKKAPVLFWVLDLWPDTLKAIGVVKSEKVLNLVGKMVAFIYNNCDLILAQSNSFIENIANYCKKPEKIKYFPSWAEDIFTPESIQYANEIPEVSKNKFKIIFAGNIGEAQDFDSIIKAATLTSKNNDIHWLIVGDGRQANYVREKVKEFGLEDKFIMLGSYPLERMPSFYASADALLVSLKDEPIFSMTIPGKIQSYLASGKPVIGMLNGEGSNAIVNAEAGLVCRSGDADCLAETVIQMSLMPKEKLIAMGQSGRNYYDKQFHKKILIDRLEEWFLDVTK